MKKYPSFKIDLYEVTINVICCEKWREEVKRILAKENIKDIDMDNTEAYALKVSGKNGYYVFFGPSVANRIVYHECIHLMIFVMDGCNLILDVDNSESIAYLGEYIIDNVMRIKKQKPRTIKHPAKRGILTKAQIKKAVKGAIEKRKKK